MLPSIIKRELLSYCAVGSRNTCSPPPMDTDEDWLGLVEETELVPLEELLTREQWTPGITSEEQERYGGVMRMSWKKTIDDTLVNLILTVDLEHYNRFIALSSVAARLNLTNKADRVALFRAGLDNTVATLPDGRDWRYLNGGPTVQAAPRVPPNIRNNYYFDWDSIEGRAVAVDPGNATRGAYAFEIEAESIADHMQSVVRPGALDPVQFDPSRGRLTGINAIYIEEQQETPATWPIR